MTAQVPVRRDRSAAVKESIRAAATALFTERGFDATGIRDIAAAAEVNPAIVLRHFGSKEGLFIQTVDSSHALREMIEGPLSELGRRAVRGVLLGRRSGGLRVFGIVVRASGRADIRAKLQASLIEHFVAPLVPLIGGPDAELRAHLFAAQFIGLLSALVLYDDGFLQSAAIEDVVEIYGDGLQLLLDGGAPSPHP